MAGGGGFLERLTTRQREVLLGAGRERSYDPGAVLMTQGSPADSVVLLSSGAVRVVAVTPDGNEVTLSVEGAGDLLGTLGALTDPPTPRAGTVRAIVAVRARTIPTRAFLAILREEAGIAVALLADIAEQWGSSSRRHIQLAVYPVEQRLARLLVELAGDGARHEGVPLSQTDLAGMIGTSRDSAARVLARFRDEGLVSTARRSVQILDPAGLQARAHPDL